MTVKTVQLGKNGVTEGFLELLMNHFANTNNVKVNVLKSCCRDKQELREIKDQILEMLGKKYTARTVGYTIALKKHDKETR
ncbi:MAG: YhbY family RNA-binding protein [Candidatus Pacearchaeota archaeon]